MVQQCFMELAGQPEKVGFWRKIIFYKENISQLKTAKNTFFLRSAEGRQVARGGDLHNSGFNSLSSSIFQMLSLFNLSFKGCKLKQLQSFKEIKFYSRASLRKCEFG